MKIALAVSLFIILIGLGTSMYFYPQLPSQIGSHWDAAGNINGYMDKNIVLFLMPVLSLLLVLLFFTLQRVDPLRGNIKKFSDYYEGFIIVVVFFLLYVHGLVIAWNLGVGFSMSQMLAPAIGVLFFFIGILTSKAKRNYSIGIRTPWTLANERVWEKTHVVSGKLFKIAGIIAIFGAVFVQYAFYFVLIPVIAVSIFAYVYSYDVFRKIKAKKR